MTFEKRSDGRFHWKYIGRNNRQHIRILWLCWLFAMVILFAAVGIEAAVIGIPKESQNAVMMIAAGLGLFVTLIFLMVWIWERFGMKTYAYSVSEKDLLVLYGRYRTLNFDHVKSVVRCKNRNAVILKTAITAVEIFAADDDYEAVWSFLTEHCSDNMAIH